MQRQRKWGEGARACWEPDASGQPFFPPPPQTRTFDGTHPTTNPHPLLKKQQRQRTLERDAPHVDNRTRLRVLLDRLDVNARLGDAGSHRLDVDRPEEKVVVLPVASTATGSVAAAAAGTSARTATALRSPAVRRNAAHVLDRRQHPSRRPVDKLFLEDRALGPVRHLTRTRKQEETRMRCGVNRAPATATGVTTRQHNATTNAQQQ